MVQSPPRSASARGVRRRPDRGVTGFLRDLAIIVVVAVLASLLIKTFLIRSFFIPSGSMQNTLQVNDRILVNELVPGLIPLQRGDVIVFKDPDQWLDDQPQVAPPTGPVAVVGDWVLSVFGLSTLDANDHLVKRVIGLPGDHVTCCNSLGQLTVNGVPLDEPYIVHSGSQDATQWHFDVTVKPGTLWVMGDNRFNSCDSACNLNRGKVPFVPLKDVVGRAFVVSWPVGHWSWLSNYPDTFSGVPAPGG